jgi:hypothetical protein
MSFNVAKFFRDYHFDIAPKNSKHARSGWTNTHCPFCNGRDYHLGINNISGAVKCWKCGTHSQTDMIKALLSCDFSTAEAIREEYTTERSARSTYQGKDSTRENKNIVCEYPTGTANLTTAHKAYLERRGFNAEHLEKVWGLKGTSHIGDYRFRIIAPILFDGVMVSYQGRDITDKQALRYKACKQKDEVMEHQNVVYGLDLVKGDHCVVVEGIVDAWRMGPGGVSCFGTAFTLAQVNLLASRLKRVSILFDADDDNAAAMARELAVALSALGVEVEILDISDTPSEYLVDPEKGIDPGNTQQWYADQIMKELNL